MGAVFSSPSLALLAGGVFLAVYLLYRAVLPKPLPGIPYNKDAANKLLGDVGEMTAYTLRTKQIFCWLTSLTTRHRSPIVQVFVKPMSLPWIVVTDPFESQDCLLRRKEFDRTMFGDFISGVLPEQHIQFLSSDSRFKDNRNLINHLMAPSFIREVSAPEVYKSLCTLMKVWELKSDLAKGHPFTVQHDLLYGALDAIFASSYGLSEAESITPHRLEAIRSCTPVIPDNTDKPVDFPDGDIPQIFRAILRLSDAIMATQRSAFPSITSWVMNQIPSMKKAKAFKDKFMADKVDEAVRRIDDGDFQAKDAMHSVMLREREVAAKQGRPPAYTRPGIKDEFLGFTFAGYDTSSTATAWGFKYLTDHPTVQERLRADLRAAMPDAVAEGRAPSYQELINAHVPYLDAVVEEVLRHANAIAFVVRVALEDTVILGRRIPKGTDVFFMANGAGYLEPAIPVDDEERSPGARRATGKGLSGAWDDRDIGAFKPERWLVVDEATGKETFNPMAGPSLAFGLGNRGCFGKKLGLISLKMQFALSMWHFHLAPIPRELGGYEGIQNFAREPKQCFVRMKRVLE